MIDRTLHPELAELLDRLTGQYGGAIRSSSLERGELTVTIGPGDLLDVLTYLKGDCAFRSLNDIIALDNLGAMGEGRPRFTLLYQLYRFPCPLRLRVRIDVAEDEVVSSIYLLYRSADWAEREIFDLFGISFRGHPDLRRIFMGDDFEGFPLRKDFPLAGRQP